MSPLAFKQEKQTEFRDTVVTMFDRQFGLHAGTIHHHRGGVRRHSGAYVGALFGPGRDPRVHHPGVARWTVPGGVDQSRQAGESRTASTTSGTSSTSRPTIPGAMRGATSGS